MKRLSKNILSLSVADLARRLFGFITVAYLARIVGTETFGALNTAYAVLAYGVVLSTSGLTTYGIRSVAQGASNELVSTIISERFTTTVLTLVLIGVCSYAFIEHSTVKLLVLLFALTLIPQAFNVEWYYQGKESMAIVALARSTLSLVPMVVALLFVHTSSDIWKVALGSFAGDSLASMLLFWKLRSDGVRVHFRVTVVPRLFLHSFPLTAGIMLATLVINFPPLALSIVRSQADVGLYSAASKLVFFLLIGDRLLGAVLLPALSRKSTDSVDSLSSLIVQAFQWILLSTLPILIAGMFFAEDVFGLVFGAQYSIAAPVLQVFLWYFLVTMLHTVGTSLLIALKNERFYGTVMGLTALLYVILVTGGAYAWGPVGAAVGVVVAESVSLLLLAIGILHRISIPFPTKLITSCVLATGAMILSLVVSKSLWVVWQLAISFATFYGVAYCTGGFTNDDLRTLKSTFL